MTAPPTTWGGGGMGSTLLRSTTEPSDYEDEHHDANRQLLGPRWRTLAVHGDDSGSDHGQRFHVTTATA